MIVSEMMGQGVQPFGGRRHQGAGDEGDELGLGPLPYVVASLSTLPVIGLLFALIAIPWGLATLARGGKVVAFLGALGVGTQFLLTVGAVHLVLFR